MPHNLANWVTAYKYPSTRKTKGKLDIHTKKHHLIPDALPHSKNTNANNRNNVYPLEISKNSIVMSSVKSNLVNTRDNDFKTVIINMFTIKRKREKTQINKVRDEKETLQQISRKFRELYVHTVKIYI